MKKLIALMFAVLFLGAGIATASDLSMTGKYTVRGQYFDNGGKVTAPPADADDRSYAAYDQELTADSKWKMDDTTFVFARFNIRDQTWGKNGNTVTEELNDGTPEDNIEAQQVWGQTTFANGISLKVGLMAAGAWGTDFGNTSTEAYRVFTTVPTQIGNVIGILEKPNGYGLTGQTSENGSDSIGENNDTDVYHLALVTKLGDVNIAPIVSFINANNNNYAADAQQILVQLSITGKAGMIGYEADFSFRDVDKTIPENVLVTSTMDYQLFGAYGNVWYQMQALRIGAFAAYGSWDEDAQAGYDFGDDFAPGKLLLMGDGLLGEGTGNVGAQNPSAAALAAYPDSDKWNNEGGMIGSSLFGIYGEYAVTDKLTLSAVAAYATPDRDRSNDFAGSAAIRKWDDAEIFELSGGFVYKITPSLTYDGGVGMATVDYGDATVDPDTLVEAFHRLSFAF
ncbi:MAG: hypothetical protein NDI81_09125 [Desulfobacula sp.]|nr:hypothetical protein [Desulfobacula sp.]